MSSAIVTIAYADMKNSYTNWLSAPALKKLVTSALREDIGCGDITTRLAIPASKRATAVIVAGDTGILCGIDVARCVFVLVDRKMRFSPLAKDGQRIRRGQAVASIKGSASSILTAERLALNFLGLLSGISTRTARFVSSVRPYATKILDTRKTIPGLRALQKYAVRVGGGYNHRGGLFDMVLIKENHIDAARPLGSAALLSLVKARIPSRMPIEIEVRTLKEFRDVLSAKPAIILLDNMSPGQIRKAVRLRNAVRGSGRPCLEASGAITLKTIPAYAATGVDYVSLGTLTKDLKAFDFSLEWKVR